MLSKTFVLKMAQAKTKICPGLASVLNVGSTDVTQMACHPLSIEVEAHLFLGCGLFQLYLGFIRGLFNVYEGFVTSAFVTSPLPLSLSHTHTMSLSLTHTHTHTISLSLDLGLLGAAGQNNARASSARQLLMFPGF